MYIQVNSDEQFDQLLSTYGNDCIIDFGASWCGPCKSLAPRFKTMSERTQIVALSVDVDECPMTARRYAITSVPKILRFKNGRVVKQYTGNPPDNVLRDLIII